MSQGSRQRRKRVTVTVYLDADQVDALSRLHQQTKVPTAVRIREGVDLMLAKHGRRRK